MAIKDYLSILKFLTQLEPLVDKLVGAAEDLFKGKGQGALKQKWVRDVLIYALGALKDVDLDINDTIEGIIDYQIERAVDWLKRFKPEEEEPAPEPVPQPAPGFPYTQTLYEYPDVSKLAAGDRVYGLGSLQQYLVYPRGIGARLDSEWELLETISEEG